MIVSCVHFVQSCSALRGNSYKLAAEILGVGNGSVSKVMKEYRKLEAQQGTDEVQFEEREKETRKREQLVKRSHENYVQYELFKMIEMEDLEELPTVRSLYQRIQDNKATRAAMLHVSVEKVWPFSLTTFWKVMRKLGYLYQNDTDDRERLMLQPHVVDHKLYYHSRISQLRALAMLCCSTWMRRG